jgi:hypothetical protein
MNIRLRTSSLILIAAAMTLPALSDARAFGRARRTEPTARPSNTPSNQGESDAERGFNNAASGDFRKADESGGDALQHGFLDNNDNGDSGNSGD